MYKKIILIMLFLMFIPINVSYSLSIQQEMVIKNNLNLLQEIIDYLTRENENTVYDFDINFQSLQKINNQYTLDLKTVFNERKFPVYFWKVKFYCGDNTVIGLDSNICGDTIETKEVEDLIGSVKIINQQTSSDRIIIKIKAFDKKRDFLSKESISVYIPGIN